MNHHAYLFEHRSDNDIEYVFDHIRKNVGFEPIGHPDFLYIEYDSMGIDESRFLQDWQSKKPVAGDKKAVIVRANNLTREAQNALLKMFEEPTAGTFFFVVVPDIFRIIPTLQSRFSIQTNTDTKTSSSGIDVDEFLKATIAKRMKMLDSIIEEKNKLKTRQFLDELEEKVGTKAGDVIFKAKDFLNDQGSSIKMLLEMVVSAV